jgi:hypothetical protein
MNMGEATMVRQDPFVLTVLQPVITSQEAHTAKLVAKGQ